MDYPFDPVSLALGAEATFVARTIDSGRQHLTSVLAEDSAHCGTSLVEIYQNFPIFNAWAFDVLKDREAASETVIPLVDGQAVRFGVGGGRGVFRRPNGELYVDEVDATTESDLVVHDAGTASVRQRLRWCNLRAGASRR
ncbi:hypothetical protein ACFTWF_42420 [Rhodococcus sp. NPDC056960]|uniref:hypothetical protein n=1 Tax=Rhodococcus TaxID=1827 RepID=UPI003643F1D4